MSEYCVHAGWGKCPYKQPKPTNAEKIRSLPDEALAEFLINFKNTFGTEYEGEMSCLEWLKDTE